MPNITFLIGAGASADALKPVNGFNAQLAAYGDPDKAFFKAGSNLSGYFAPDQEQKFKGYFKFFASQVNKTVAQLNSVTIDQHAKKLFDNGALNEYEDIKCLLSAFFSLEQLHPEFLDLNFDNEKSKFDSKHDINRRNIDSRYRYLWSLLAQGNKALKQQCQNTLLEL